MCGHAKVQEGRGCLARLGGRPGRGAVKVARAPFFLCRCKGGKFPYMVTVHGTMPGVKKQMRVAKEFRPGTLCIRTCSALKGRRR